MICWLEYQVYNRKADKRILGNVDHKSHHHLTYNLNDFEPWFLVLFPLVFV